MRYWSIRRRRDWERNCDNRRRLEFWGREVKRAAAMTKADLIDRVCERVNCSKKEAEAAVEEVFTMLRECLRRGAKVKISGFGSFAVNQKRARRGRNPRTGAALTISSRRVLSFKPSELLKARILNRRHS